jgi:hypothetical protein
MVPTPLPPFRSDAFFVITQGRGGAIVSSIDDRI